MAKPCESCVAERWHVQSKTFQEHDSYIHEVAVNLFEKKKNFVTRMSANKNSHFFVKQPAFRRWFFFFKN